MTANLRKNDRQNEKFGKRHPQAGYKGHLIWVKIDYISPPQRFLISSSVIVFRLLPPEAVQEVETLRT